MREITNYRELRTAVQTWLNRNDATTVAMIPGFINFAEKQFTRLLRLPFYENEVRQVIKPETPFVEIPQDFLGIRHLLVNGRALTHLDPESFHRQKKKGVETEDSTPLYWTRMGFRIITLPALKEGDEVSLMYHRDIPEMVDDIDAPYSLIVAPDVLLYLALRHASIFLRDNEQEAFWMAKAKEAADDVRAQLDEADWAGNSLAVSQYEYN